MGDLLVIIVGIPFRKEYSLIDIYLWTNMEEGSQVTYPLPRDVTSTGKHSKSLWMVPLIGLAFASTQLTWALFNNAVPVFLEGTYGLSFKLIGFIMTLDNIIALFLQPYIGTRSDNTRTKLGRRLPYIIPGMIFGASFFFLIPFARDYSLYVFLSTIIIFNLSMAIYRSPSVSLMPDLISPEKRSAGNGIVNLMGGLFSGTSLFVAGGMLRAGNAFMAFGFVSAGVLISLVLVLLTVREPDYPELTEKEKSESAFVKLRKEIGIVTKSDDKSYLFMLIAILSWFMAWNAIEAFYSLYVGRSFLPGVDGDTVAGIASQVQFVFPLVFVVFTLIGGLLGTTIGRLRTMKIGLLFFTLAIVVGASVQTNSVFGISVSWQTSFRVIFAVAGASWGLINVNSIVVIWHHASDNGTGSGLYYAFASIAAIAGPTLSGYLMDFNFRYLFPFSIAFLIIAMLFLFLVRTGEVEDDHSFVSDAVGEMID